MAFLPILGVVAGIASTAVSAVGAMKQAQATSDAAKYNAQVKSQQAAQVEDQTGAKVSNDALKTRQRVAAARAGSIQNGFETDGSVNDIMRTIETQGELDQLTSLYDGTVRAQGLRQGAELDRTSASNAMTAGYLNAGSSILSGASKLYTAGNSLGLG